MLVLHHVLPVLPPVRAQLLLPVMTLCPQAVQLLLPVVRQLLQVALAVSHVLLAEPLRCDFSLTPTGQVSHVLQIAALLQLVMRVLRLPVPCAAPPTRSSALPLQLMLQLSLHLCMRRKEHTCRCPQVHPSIRQLREPDV